MALACRPCLRNPLLPSFSWLSPSSSLLHARSAAAPRVLSTLRCWEPPSWGFAAAARSATSASAPHTLQDTSPRDTTVSAVDSPDNSSRRKSGGGRGSSWLWRNPRDLVPFRGGLFTPSGIVHALWQTTESINRLLKSLSPSHLFRRVKENDNSYKLQLEVPGLSKDDLKVTVEDNLLVITGEKKEEEEEGGWDEEDYWASRSYGYYHTTLMLPEDAKADEIKAEVKHGVLYLTIPRTGEKRRDVREVEVL